MEGAHFLFGVIIEEGAAGGALTNSPADFFYHFVESTRKYVVTIRGIVPWTGPGR